MKNREIEKQLKNELSVASRSDFSALMKKCEGGDGIVLKRERVVAYAGGGTSTRTDTGFKPILAVGILFLLIVALLIILPLGFDSGSSSGYFVIDINPSVKISYNESGAVTGVTALNEDAEVLLVGLDLSGKEPEEAVSILFEKCVALGYFSAERDNNAVLASATTDGGERDEERTKQIKELFTKEFSNKKMRGVVITSIDDPALDEKAESHGIDSQKYALILSYLDMGGELSEEQYDDISISELYSKISDKEKELKNKRLDDTKLAQERAQGELFNTLASSVSALLQKLEACIIELDSNTENSVQGNERPSAPGLERPAPDLPTQGSGKPPFEAPKERYEGFSKNLGDYVIELEIAKKASDCKRAVDGILSILADMREDEENASLVELIDSTITQIQTLYEEFTKSSEELSSLKASAEETNSARLDAFKDTVQEKHENVEDWQKEKEHEIASSWYELKKQWNDERKNDLKSN